MVVLGQALRLFISTFLDLELGAFQPILSSHNSIFLMISELIGVMSRFRICEVKKCKGFPG